jgi:hypothetical protein
MGVTLDGDQALSAHSAVLQQGTFTRHASIPVHDISVVAALYVMLCRAQTPR